MSSIRLTLKFNELASEREYATERKRAKVCVVYGNLQLYYYYYYPCVFRVNTFSFSICAKLFIIMLEIDLLFEPISWLLLFLLLWLVCRVPPQFLSGRKRLRKEMHKYYYYYEDETRIVSMLEIIAKHFTGQMWTFFGIECRILCLHFISCASYLSRKQIRVRCDDDNIIDYLCPQFSSIGRAFMRQTPKHLVPGSYTDRIWMKAKHDVFN